MPVQDSTPTLLRQHRPFMVFWCARIASGFAFQMLSVAVGWQIYAITGRALDLGLIGLVQFAPSLLLALPAGHLADQFNRRRIVAVCQFVEALGVAALALGSVTGVFGELQILAAVLVIGVARAIESPARQALLPGLVPASVLGRALAVNSSAGQMAMIVGPALGGFIYIAGPAAVYTVSTVLYAAAVVFLWRLEYHHRPPRRQPASVRTLLAGVRYIRGHPVVLGALSLDLFAVLLGGATALLPIFAHDILHTGPWGLGLLRAAPAIGALGMSVWLAHHALKRHVGMIMFVSVACFGAATLVFALSTSLLLSMAALCALGAFDMISMVIRGALVQLETPDDMRGRVSSVNSIFINTSNQLGEFESGITAAWFGAVPAVLIGGFGTLIVCALWMYWFPSLRRRQHLQSDSPSGA